MQKKLICLAEGVSINPLSCLFHRLWETGIVVWFYHGRRFLSVFIRVFSVPPSNSLVVSDQLRVFGADMAPSKGPQPQRVRYFLIYGDTMTLLGVACLARRSRDTVKCN